MLACMLFIGLHISGNGCLGTFTDGHLVKLTVSNSRFRAAKRRYSFTQHVIHVYEICCHWLIWLKKIEKIHSQWLLVKTVKWNLQVCLWISIVESKQQEQVIIFSLFVGFLKAYGLQQLERFQTGWRFGLLQHNSSYALQSLNEVIF